MKNRRFPYGYEMKNGVIVVCPSEADILRQIFADYIGGAFLKAIADRLSDEKVEYLPGKYDWNKNRIKRIIEDERYMGTDTYETIIDKDTFLQANSTKDSRRTHVGGTVNADNRTLVKSVHCAYCGGQMMHRSDLSRSKNEFWCCKSKECGSWVKMTIADLEDTVIQILNRLIDNPMLSDSTDSQYTYEPSLDIQRMNNDIERMIESLDSDRETTQKLILECAAKKCNEHKSARHIADRLKADLERSGPLSSYSPELFDRTVSSVTIDQNSQVQLVLKNGIIVGKEM